MLTDTKTRKLRVKHATTYRYAEAVARSSHAFHLRPIDDWRQTLLTHSIRVTPGVPVIEFDDVFGNWAQRCEIDEPWKELSIVAESTVEVLDFDPFAFTRQPIRRPEFPIAWMPWEQQMLQPYLTPEELPHGQLKELLGAARAIVMRNDNDIMETLFDINLTLFREFRYVSGSTSLATTAYDVFHTRRGVCQDLSNLFIMFARLLGIPARYVCGYLYTGNTGASRAASDATHAWVQLYIPDVGWKGFDPTNGVLPTTNHVRVAVGRHYRDVAPTAGALFGGSGESMRIDVEVSRLDAVEKP